MFELLNTLLAQKSLLVYPAITLLLALSAIGIPVPEEVVTVAAAVAAHRGYLEAFPAWVSCYLGVITADVGLMYFASHVGMRLLRRKWMKRMLHPRRLHWARKQIAAHGAWAVLASRFIPGSRMATLIIAGRPWGITQAFATWGSLVAEHSGLADPVFWTYWDEPTRVGLLHRSLLLDATTLMNVGLMLGALLAAGLAGRFAPVWRIGIGPLAAAIIGGLILGYGARMAFGCNISAFFSGVASGSVHGWLWIAAALPGNYLGTLLRPFFGLERGGMLIKNT